MKLNYVNKIKANISIYSSKKTTNLLDGTYKSIYIGKSMNFENLREYVINDDIKDIDWKASARSGTLYVKQFIAEKKHNILLVMDTGMKMSADTSKHQKKKDVALFTAGTIGYLAIKNNDYVGVIYTDSKKIQYKPFKPSLYNLEEYLCDYDKNYSLKGVDINSLLKFTYKNIQKKMIVFVITDIEGINNIKTSVLKELNQKADILVVNIDDNYMFGNDVYDVEDNKYIPKFFLNDSKLHKVEKEIRKDLLRKNVLKLKRKNTCFVSIDSVENINYKIIELLEEHKNVSIN